MKTSIWRLTALAAIAAIGSLISLQAGAQTQEQIDWCEKGGPSPDDRIAACTAVVTSSKYQGKAAAWAYNNRGIAYRNKKQYDRAIEDYTQAIRLDTDNTDSYFNRGIIYKLLGNLDQAISDYSRAIVGYSASKYPLDYKRDYYKARGNAYSAKGNFQRAVLDYSEAIKADEKYARAYYNRGVAKRKLNDSAGAEADIARARELQPDITDEDED